MPSTNPGQPQDELYFAGTSSCPSSVGCGFLFSILKNTLFAPNITLSCKETGLDIPYLRNVAVQLTDGGAAFGKDDLIVASDFTCLCMCSLDPP